MTFQTLSMSMPITELDLHPTDHVIEDEIHRMCVQLTSLPTDVIMSTWTAI